MFYTRTITHIITLLALLVMLGACEQKKTSSAPSAAQATGASTPVTPESREAQAKARVWVWQGLNASFQRVAPRDQRAVQRVQREQGGERPEMADASHMSILFSANNHGEREDCGCKRHPLGGLDRRATMVALAKNADAPDAQTYWGKDARTPEALFVVDAGDGFYKSTATRRSAPDYQKRAQRHATAVVEALNASPPDVVNLGEVDLAMGWADVERLHEKATFPIISANLVRVDDGERPFAGHVVVERGAHKVAFIGVIKETPREPKYYAERGLRVEPPAQAYLREVAEIGADVDAVVLLSNEGMDRTEDLVRAIRKEDGRVDAALVSNSNRLIRRPEWVDGVPVLEPMSRGKYFGRVDIWRTGEGPLDYANDAPALVRALTTYQRAFQRYLQTRAQWAKNLLRQAAFEAAVAAGDDPQPTPSARRRGATKQEISKETGAAKDHINEQAQARRRAELEQLIDRTTKRLTLASEDVITALANLQQATSSGERVGGDDWFEARVMPVEIKITQDADVRRVLDRYVDEK